MGEYGLLGRYKPHPDPNQERLFFGLLGECLDRNLVSRDKIAIASRSGMVRASPGIGFASDSATHRRPRRSGRRPHGTYGVARRLSREVARVSDETLTWVCLQL